MLGNETDYRKEGEAKEIYDVFSVGRAICPDVVHDHKDEEPNHVGGRKAGVDPVVFSPVIVASCIIVVVDTCKEIGY